MNFLIVYCYSLQGCFILGLFLFTSPVANLVAYSWWIAFGFTGFFYSSYFRLFLCTKRASLTSSSFKGFNLLIALYLVAYGFVVLPVVTPTILEFG